MAYYGSKAMRGPAKKKGLAKRRSARKAYEKVAKTSKPGTGKRFAAVEKSIAASGARDPGAIAAMIGRKKYGAKKFAAMGAAGRKRAAAKRNR